MEKKNKKDFFEISVKKENFRFNSAHFISSISESLHGHNYTVKVNLIGENKLINGMLMDFTELSPLIQEICNKIHQKVILPKFSTDFCLVENSAEQCVDIFDK